MKKLLILLLLSTSLSTFASSQSSLFLSEQLDFTLSDFCVEQPEVQEREGVFYYVKGVNYDDFPETITATSICIYKDANEQYQSKGELKNGKKDGKWTSWFDNGQILTEKFYKDGEIDGESTWWYKSGELHSVTTFKDGKRVGQSTSWHTNGQISTITNSKNGKYDGITSSWYENGQKFMEILYKDDIAVSITEYTYNKNGQIKNKWNYKNGKLVSQTDYHYYENGQLEAEAPWKDGKLNGKMTMWYENGQIAAEAIYKDGVCISGDC